MKTLSSALPALLTLVFASVLATPARADEAIVHVTTANPDVVLEGIDADGNVGATCAAPCDRPLDLRLLYRIDGDGIRPSEPFLLGAGPTGRVDVVARAGSSGKHKAGLVLTIIGGTLLATGGVLVLVAGTAIHGDLAGTGGAILAAMNCGAAGLGTLVPGIVLLATSPSSTVTQRGEDVAPRAPMWFEGKVAPPRAAPLTVPLFTKVF